MYNAHTKNIYNYILYASAFKINKGDAVLS